MQSYLLEDLASTFAKHADELEKKQKQMRKQYKKDHDGQDLPDYMKDPFNLSRALSVMAQEIENLKKAQELKMGY